MKDYKQKINTLIGNLRTEMQWHFDEVYEQAYKKGYAAGYDRGYEEGIEKSKKQTKIGQWVENDRGIPICSCCGKYKYEDIDGSIYDDIWFPNYCPNCGIKMVERQESEE